MMRFFSLGFAIIALTTMSAAKAQAVCDDTTVAGTWAALFNGVYYVEGLPTSGTAIVDFDGAGGIKINAGRETAAGEIIASYYGIGRYGVRTNCSGLGSINLFDPATRVQVGSVRIEIVIGGSSSAPTVSGIVMNADPTQQYSGTVMLNRVDF
jgi:hypothetical protein